MPRLPAIVRLAALPGIALVASCGHLGIDLEGDGPSAIDGQVTDDGNGAGPQSGDSGGGASTTTGGTSSGDGGASSGGAADTGGSTASGGNSGGTGGSTSCAGGTDVDFGLVGWAAEEGGTTGGQNGQTVVAWSGSELVQLLANKNPQLPLTIRIVGTITPANTGDDKIDVDGVQDVTIVGQGDQGVFDGIGLRVINASNIILRNLHIHHVDIGEMDSVGLAGPADHIWIDHCEFDAEFEGAPKGTYDGLVDAKANVSYVTYSWNYIHDSWNAMLVGSTEMDTFDRRLTMHHNRISNVDSGVPSYRGGNGHIFNNLYEDVATIAINSRTTACLRVENNVFHNVANPWASAFSPMLGGAETICNELDAASIFDYSKPDVSPTNECQATVPYDYADFLTETSAVADIVTANAGVDKLADPEDYWQGRWRGTQP